MVDSRHSSHVAQRGVRAPTDMSSMRVRTGPIPLDQMMLSVGTETGPTSQSSYVGAGEGPYKAHEVSLKSDIESNPEIALAEK